MKSITALAVPIKCTHARANSGRSIPQMPEVTEEVEENANWF